MGEKPSISQTFTYLTARNSQRLLQENPSLTIVVLVIRQADPLASKMFQGNI